MRLKLWPAVLRRATWDLDLLGRGRNSVDDVVAVVQELCGLEAGDGTVFDPSARVGEEMRAGEQSPGVRIRLDARLAGARIPVQVDVGFGDAVVPPPARETSRTLLDHPLPRILVYPCEAVVAEELEAIIALGSTNSRMKDFHDLSVLASSLPFEDSSFVRAVRATFERRGTTLPDTAPHVFSGAVLAAPERRAQWWAFVRRSRLEAPPNGPPWRRAFSGSWCRCWLRRRVAARSGPPGRPAAPGGPAREATIRRTGLRRSKPWCSGSRRTRPAIRSCDFLHRPGEVAKLQWALEDSNLRPLPCKGSALDR